VAQVIPTERGQALAQELGINFKETSAKSNIGVEEAFFDLARDIKKRLIDTQQTQQPKRKEDVHLDSAPAKTTNSCCQ
jgi:Ras-related protein Rab-8A